MASKTLFVTLDDLDGSEGATPTTFAFNGNAYEIDLSAEHLAELRRVLAPYITAARQTGGKPSSKKMGKKAGSGDANEIRLWAREHDMKVPDRGRISRKIREAYEAATR